MQTRRFLFPTFRISCQASDTSEEELTEADAKARRPATRRCATRRSRASASKNGAADATFPLAVCVGPTMLETRYSVGSGATGTKARETRERADSSSKSNGSIPSNTTLACTCYAHLVTCSAKTQTNFRRDLHPFFFAPCFRFHPLFFSFSCVSFPLLPSTIYLILASIFALFSFAVIILAEGGATKLRTTRWTTFEGYRKWDQCRGIAILCKQRRCIGLRPSPRAFSPRFTPACSLVLPPLSLYLSLSLFLSAAHGSSSLYRLFHVPRSQPPLSLRVLTLT